MHGASKHSPPDGSIQAIFSLVIVSIVVQGLCDVMYLSYQFMDSFLCYWSPFLKALAFACRYLEVLKIVTFRVLGLFLCR